MKKLITLAEECRNGACNQYALARALGDALRAAGMSGINTVAYRYVLGHLSFLAGESIGPSEEVAAAFEKELAECRHTPENP